MSLKPAEQRLLDKFNDGGLRNRSPLVNGSGERQLESLVDMGHLSYEGTRLRRTIVSFHADRVFAATPRDGTALSNARIREKAGLTEVQYEKAKNLLLRTGDVAKSRGRGGSLRRLAQVSPGTRAGAAARESELYEPFQRWLNGQEANTDDVFWRTKVTAHGTGQRRSTGEWTRPDVVSLSLHRWEYLPTLQVQLSTYEIKPFGQARRLAGVYEAAAQQRRSHYSYLVIEWPIDEDVPVPDVIVDETVRLSIGLCQIWGHEVQVIHESQYSEPTPEELNDFIGDLLDDNERRQYLDLLRGDRN